MTEYITEWTDGLPDMARYGEEVVRCRDCKYSFVWWSEFYGVDTRYCQRLRQVADGLINAKVEDDGFCAWGVKK